MGQTNDSKIEIWNKKGLNYQIEFELMRVIENL